MIICNIEYLLGLDWDGYQIVAHHTNDPDEEGSCCFNVCDYSITDGDGCPRTVDDSYVRIDKTDYLHVMRIFRQAARDMCDLGDKAGKPLDRPIAAGDYLYYSGDYVHINFISAVTGEYWGKYVNGCKYDITLSSDIDCLTGETGDYEKSDFEEYKLITRAEFDKAINIAKSAILEATAYLKSLYLSKLRSDS